MGTTYYVDKRKKALTKLAIEATGVFYWYSSVGHRGKKVCVLSSRPFQVDWGVGKFKADNLTFLFTNSNNSLSKISTFQYHYNG